MPVGVQLMVSHEVIHRLSFQHHLLIIWQIVEETMVADHVAAVDIRFFKLGLLIKTVNAPLCVETQCSESGPPDALPKGCKFCLPLDDLQ